MPSSSVRLGLGLRSEEVAQPAQLTLDVEGVCVRAGHHCAQPLMRSLGVHSTVRASFWVYNSTADIARLAAAVRAAQERFAVL